MQGSFLTTLSAAFWVLRVTQDGAEEVEVTEDRETEGEGENVGDDEGEKEVNNEEDEGSEGEEEEVRNSGDKEYMYVEDEIMT